ncbi:phosphotransferase enzyme family protein [Streptomyces sp. NPDC086782]|uniref:phosphotransferase enzyme family protein n=1 Tax=Streptomyces sp. NPDC086782 TaxID=3365757 RepID=UPI0038241560
MVQGGPPSPHASTAFRWSSPTSPATATVPLQVQQYEDNAVWRVTPPGGAPFVARLSVRDGRPAHQQRSEMRWLESLATSCTVAVPGHDGPSTLALLHWVPGIVELPYQEPGMAEQMGIATAQLHHNSATVEIADLDRPVWDAETILLKGHALNDPAAHQQMGTEGTAALWEVTERITPALQEGGDSDRGRIHGDLHRENMILMPGGGSVGVIDFDDCGTGNYLLDIATVLGSIHRIAHKTPGTYESFAHAYLAGYTSVRPLPADFDRLLEPYLLLRDGFVLNFVTAAVLANEAVATTWGPGRIAGIVASM